MQALHCATTLEPDGEDSRAFCTLVQLKQRPAKSADETEPKIIAFWNEFYLNKRTKFCIVNWREYHILKCGSETHFLYLARVRT